MNTEIIEHDAKKNDIRELRIQDRDPIPGSPYTIEGLYRLSKFLLASGYIKDAESAEQCFARILYGSELGIGPMVSLNEIIVVKGKATFSAVLMASQIKKGGYDYEVVEHTNDKCVLRFVRKGKALGTAEFSTEDARRAGLLGKDNWKNYPRNMVFWRAMSNGARMFCSDAFGGAAVYTPDEAEEIADDSGRSNGVNNLENKIMQLAEHNQSQPIEDYTIKTKDSKHHGAALADLGKEKVVEEIQLDIYSDEDRSKMVEYLEQQKGA